MDYQVANPRVFMRHFYVLVVLVWGRCSISVGATPKHWYFGTSYKHPFYSSLLCHPNAKRRHQPVVTGKWASNANNFVQILCGITPL
jgi:hypothetical protein